MRIFIAQPSDGEDAKALQPFVDALCTRGCDIVSDLSTADACVLARTDMVCCATHFQAMALDAFNRSQATGSLRLYEYPLRKEPLPLGYKFYLDVATVLPSHPEEATRVLVNDGAF